MKEWIVVFVLAQYGLAYSHGWHRHLHFFKKIDTTELNNRPIIGILSHVYDAHRQYLPATYVKFLESAGARVVPIFNNLTTDHYAGLFKSLNGILFPGGGVNLHTSGYFGAAKIFYQLAVSAYAKGDIFPIWGTCLGFQALTVLGAGEDLLQGQFDSENLSLALNLTDDALHHSKLFANMPEHLVRALTKKAITFNNHHAGITPKAFIGSSRLRENFRMLSTNFDRAGKAFLSTMEGRSLPFYGIQWHTETNSFMWTKKLVISHDPDAIAVTQYMADFFVNQTRLNQHHFPTEEAEQKALIYNWHTTHTPSSDFEEIYIW